jgi:hypothetical protein
MEFSALLFYPAIGAKCSDDGQPASNVIGADSCNYIASALNVGTFDDCQFVANTKAWNSFPIFITDDAVTLSAPLNGSFQIVR